MTHVTLPSTLNRIEDEVFKETGIRTITLPKGLKHIGEEAFFDCPFLTSVVIPESVDSVGYEAFEGVPKVFWATTSEQADSLGAKMVYSLKDFPNLQQMFKVNGITYLPLEYDETRCNAVDCDPNLESINIPSSVSYDGKTYKLNHVERCFSMRNRELETLTIQDSGLILSSAFAECSSLKSINLPKNLLAIGDDAFKECEELTSINIPNSVSYIGRGAFAASSIGSINIPEGIEYIELSTFAGCKKLSSITFPSSLKAIADSAFSSCVSLETIELSSNIKDIGSRAFSGCNSLKSVIIKDSIAVPTARLFSEENINIQKTIKIGENAFLGCINLERVDLPINLTSIENGAFYGCSSLQYIIFPESLKFIGENAFANYGALRGVTFLGDKVSFDRTSFGSLDDLDSENINNISIIGLGKNIKNIDFLQLLFTNKLVEISCEGATPPSVGSLTLQNVDKQNCKLLVPPTSIASYKVAQGWKDFFVVDDISTNIDFLIETKTHSFLDVYTLTGIRLLTKATKDIFKTLPAGTYIVNGKKVMIK